MASFCTKIVKIFKERKFFDSGDVHTNRQSFWPPSPRHRLKDELKTLNENERRKKKSRQSQPKKLNFFAAMRKNLPEDILIFDPAFTD